MSDSGCDSCDSCLDPLFRAWDFICYECTLSLNCLSNCCSCCSCFCIKHNDPLKSISTANDCFNRNSDENKFFSNSFFERETTTGFDTKSSFPTEASDNGLYGLPRPQDEGNNLGELNQPLML